MYIVLMQKLLPYLLQAWAFYLNNQLPVLTTVTSVLFVMFVYKGIVSADPNIWLIVVRGGKMVKAGVGITCFLWPWENAFRLGCRLEKVQFAADNITKQMQGVVLKGVGFWTINPQTDGPYRFYKYFTERNPTSTVSSMCQSILRNQIANSSIQQVMRNREEIRTRLRSQLNKELNGWGIAIESIEITEAKIKSKTLFNDMQAQFRQQAIVKAKTTQIETKEKLQESKLTSELSNIQQAEINTTKSQQTELEQKLKRMGYQNDFQKQNIEHKLAQLEQNKEITLKKLEAQFEKEKNQLDHQCEIKKIQYEEELKKLKAEVELNKEHNENSLKKYEIDCRSRMYEKLPLQSIKINKFSKAPAGWNEILPGFHE